MTSPNYAARVDAGFADFVRTYSGAKALGTDRSRSFPSPTDLMTDFKGALVAAGFTPEYCEEHERLAAERDQLAHRLWLADRLAGFAKHNEACATRWDGVGADCDCGFSVARVTFRVEMDR